MDMSDPSIMTLAGYHYSYNKSKKVFGLDPRDPKYYDQIITKLNLQAREQKKHERNSGNMQPVLQDHTARSSRSNKKKRVLLVDDEPDSCMTFQAVLEDAGFECISYTNSVKALQEFKPYFYNLLSSSSLILL
jgi:PleD family two-component response regulator